MKLKSKHQGPVSLFSVTALALLGVLASPGWTAGPTAALTPDEAAKMLQEGEGVLKGGNAELAIS